MNHLLQNKSLHRCLFNDMARQKLAGLSGDVFDLGGGTSPAYKAFLPAGCRYFACDAIPESKPEYVVDLERPLPIPDASADAVLLFNVLEHIYDHQLLVSEAHRILRPGGRCLLYVPFLFPHHTHATPSFTIPDHFRYTPDSLPRIFRAAGFATAQTEALGGIHHVIAQLSNDLLPMRLPRAAVYGACSLLVGARNLIGKPIDQARYATGFFVTAGK